MPRRPPTQHRPEQDRSPRVSRLAWVLIAVALILPPIVYACAWDRDTMAAEVDGRMETLNALIGNFDVFPARYYEMRIERVAGELKSHPENLELYDDIAVASDRIGRDDDAIEWMARKREQLDLLEYRNLEHEYRYLANLGTFHTHRWVGSGANRDDLTDLDRGRELIAAAILLNPDAHFGREKYQLYAIEWLLDPPYWEPPSELSDEFYPPILLPKSIIRYEPFNVREPDDKREMHIGTTMGANLTNIGLGDAITGYTGLVTLGGAAESVDAFNSLGRLLELDGTASLARIAGFRLNEAIFSGGRSLHPSWSPPTEAQLANVRGFGSTYSDTNKELREWYEEARARAKASREARNAFLEDMFARGEHPDTHPKVWAKAPSFSPLPKIPNTPPPFSEGARQAKLDSDLNHLAAMIIALTLAAAGAVTLIHVGRKKKPRIASPSTPQPTSDIDVPPGSQA
jgi:hypothetical protein